MGEKIDILVAYFSKFGNTQAVAEAAAAVFQPVGILALVEMLNLTVEDFKDIDLVVMGCPTYRMNLPQDVRGVIDRLRRLGGKIVLALKTFFVVERTGPLYAGEIEHATAWSETILSTLSKHFRK